MKYWYSSQHHEPWKHYPKRKTPITHTKKSYIICDLFIQNIQDGQINTDRNVLSLPRATCMWQGKAEWEVAAKRYKVSILGWWNVLGLYNSDGFQTLWIY